MALHATQRCALVLGLPLPGAGGTGGYGLSAAARRHAHAFICWRSGLSLDSVRFFCNGTNGTVVAADASCDLYSDGSAGIPGSLVEAKTADAAPVNNTWTQWSSYTTSLTAGARYWFVHKNNNATPATNNFQHLHAAAGAVSGAYGAYQGGSQGWGWNKMESSDSGSTWGAGNYDGCIMRIKFSDGSYDGTGVTGVQSMAAASCVYDKREVGSVFTVPPNIKAYVRRCAFNLQKSGTPSGDLRYRIYRSGSLLGTSYGIPVGRVATASNVMEQAFSSSILISAGEVIRVVMGVSVTGDTNTNRYVPQDYTVENDANSKLLKPFDGTCSRTETADYTAGTVIWTDTDTSYIPFCLALDTATEFASSGGGGLKRSRVFTGM